MYDNNMYLTKIYIVHRYRLFFINANMWINYPIVFFMGLKLANAFIIFMIT